MELNKRGKTYHTQFFVGGRRFRQSLETSDWREAQKREKELISSASQGKITTEFDGFAKLSSTFSRMRSSRYLLVPRLVAP